MIRVGPWRVDRVEGAAFSLDGGAMFGVVPRAQWSKQLPPDELGRVRLAARSLLLRHDDGRVVLLDAGMGARWPGRAREIFALAGHGDGLLSELGALEVDACAVTDVVMTHLHFDHAGGLVRKVEGQGLIPTFPAATVHVQRQHLEWARRPSPRDSASFRLADFMPIIEACLLREHEGPGEIIPDLHVTISHGHTPAMQIPIIGLSQELGVVFPSDLVPTVAHHQPAWVMAYDNQPLLTVTEKAALLAEAAQKGWIVVPYHDPTVAAFKVERSPRGFDLQPVNL